MLVRFSTVMVLGVAGALVACGSGMSNTETVSLSNTTVTKDPSLGGGAPSGNAGKSSSKSRAVRKEKAVPPPGVAPFPPAEFAQFIGLRHGAKGSALRDLLPARIPSLGKRTALAVAGSTGYEYARHFVVSWQTDNGRIEYVSVRSKQAIAYLEGKNRSDRKLTALWNVTTAQARGLLGEPNDNIDRPHARTLRYEFARAGRRIGVLSLEFSKLSTPPRLSSVSVHWQN